MRCAVAVRQRAPEASSGVMGSVGVDLPVFRWRRV